MMQFQSEIAEAITPVVRTLKQEIAQAVRRQIQEATTSALSRRNVRAQVKEALEPIRHEAQEEDSVEGTQQGGAVGGTQREESAVEQPPSGNAAQSPMQIAMQEAVAALKETVRWLVETLKGLVQTVKSLLTAVVRLLQVIVLGVVEGLGLVLRPIGHLLRAAGSGLMNGSKSLLFKLLQKIVLSVLRSVLRSLVQRLTRALEGEPASRQHNDEEMESAPEAA
jgi:hypothetical protein